MSTPEDLLLELKSNWKDVLNDKANLSLTTPILTKIINHASQFDNDGKCQSLVSLLLPYLQFDGTFINSLIILNELKTYNVKVDMLISNSINELIILFDSNYYNVFKIAIKLNPIFEDLTVNLFAKDESFVNLLATEITKVLNGAKTNQLTILNLFSAMCINDQCKSIISTLYQSLLVKSIESNDTAIQIVTSLICTKLWVYLSKELLNEKGELFSLNNLCDKFLLDYENDNANEGLALLSNNLQIKDKLRTNKALIDHLINNLSGNHNLFGVLTILENLSLPNHFLKTTNSLNNFSDSNTLINVNIFTNEPKNKLTMDNDSKILEFDQKLTAGDVVKKASDLLKTNNSPLVINKSVKLLANISFKPDLNKNDNLNEGKDLIEQKKSMIKILTSYLLATSKDLKYNHVTFIKLSDREKPIFTNLDLETRFYCIRTISNSLITKDLDQLFGDKENEIISVLPFLLEFVIQYECENTKSDKVTLFKELKSSIINIVDLFNSLASISNLLQLTDNNYCRNLVFSLGFESLISVFDLNSNDNQIILVLLKTINSLLSLPICLAKFFNWEKESDANFINFQILFNCLNSGDEGIQNEAIEIFSNVCEYEPILVVLTNYNPFISKMKELANENNASNAELVQYILDNMRKFKPSLEQR